MECGSRVGKALVTYPCDLEKGHSGPCRALENQPSVRQRKTWELGQITTEQLARSVETERAADVMLAREVIVTDPPASLSEARRALHDAADVVQSLIDSRAEAIELLDQIEAALISGDMVEGRAQVSMLRAMLRV